MAGIPMCDRADQGDVLHRLRQIGQMLADLQAWHAGRDRAKLAADFRRSVRFQIEQVDMARAATHKDLNHGRPWPVGWVSGGMTAAAKVVRERKTPQRQRSNLQQCSAGDPVSFGTEVFATRQHAILSGRNVEVYGFTFQVIGSIVPPGFPHYQRVEVQMASPRFSTGFADVKALLAIPWRPPDGHACQGFYAHLCDVTPGKPELIELDEVKLGTAR